MKITCLVENTGDVKDIIPEHGLSLYIETNGYKILFDMGQSDLFEKNAKTLGIDLSEVDMAFISHGHYDHGGGLSRFLEINKKAPVYINENAFGDYYNGTEKYIGLDSSLKDSSRLVFTGDIFEVCNGLTLYSCNDRQKSHNTDPFGLNKKEKGIFMPDDFIHEHYLMIQENDKKILVSGCSHKGILNIADWFEPDYLIGGFHFSKLELSDVLQNYSKLLAKHKTHYYTCHCTGCDQFEFMKKYIKNLDYLSCGKDLVLI